MLFPARWTALAVASLVVAAPLGAQYDQAAATPVSHCGGSRLTRTAIGGGVGAWLAFFAAKVKYSDWSDASRSNSARAARIQATVLGAIVGASIGNWGLPAACGSQGMTSLPASAPARNILSSADIAKFGQNGTVYDLVFALRKQWLHTRGVELSETPGVSMSETGGRVTSAAPTLVAYLDNARLGDLEQLRTLPLTGVVAVRYYDAAQATQRFGAGHRHGVIQVITVADQPEAVGPIGPEEIQQSRIQGTVYDLVLARRRSWLSGGTAEMPGEVAPRDDPDLPVYLNDVRVGTLAALRTLPLAGVVGVRYYDGAEATFKWGLGHAHGAIQVRTSGH